MLAKRKLILRREVWTRCLKRSLIIYCVSAAFCEAKICYWKQAASIGSIIAKKVGCLEQCVHRNRIYFDDDAVAVAWLCFHHGLDGPKTYFRRIIWGRANAHITIRELGRESIFVGRILTTDIERSKRLHYNENVILESF